MMDQAFYDLLRQCTMKVTALAKDVNGTGFFVAPGLILTCAHVVNAVQSDSHTELVVNWNGQTYDAVLRKVLDEADLALLEVELLNHPYVLLSDEANPHQMLYSYGYPDPKLRPNGDPASFELEGRAGEQGRQLKCKGGQVLPGMSGAPLLNEDSGYICGVLQKTRDRNNDLGGWGISVFSVFEAFPELKARQQELYEQDSPWTKYLKQIAENEYLKKSSKPTLEDKYRQQLLDNVRNIWITGYLEEPLPSDHAHLPLIQLRLHESPDGVSVPVPIVQAHLAHSPSPGTSIVHKQREIPLPPGTPITQVYDDAHGRLLILGAPGSGKTILLLSLADYLVGLAEKSSSHPLPVVFSLSTWAEWIKKEQKQKRECRIDEWFVEELCQVRYAIPRKIAQQWVATNQIVPLLDGLDEVDSDQLRACIQAINDYLGNASHKRAPLVVCCRDEIYPEEKHILLENAVVVQPLTLDQMDDYLSRGGAPGEAVRQALHNDADLQEVAATPLILSILAELANHGTHVASFSATGSQQDLRFQVFEDYIKNRLLLSRGHQPSSYTPEKTLYWLRRLADQLKGRQQTDFYIERVQADWLPGMRLRLLFRCLETLAYGLIGGLAGGLIAARFIQFPYVLIIALICAVLLGLLGEREIQPAEVIAWSPAHLLRNVIEAEVIGLVCTLVLGLVYYELIDKGKLFDFMFTLPNYLFLNYDFFVNFFFVAFGGIGILVYALFGGLVGLIFSERGKQQEPGPPQHKRARAARMGTIIGAVVGIVQLLIYAGANKLIDQAFHMTRQEGFIYDMKYGSIAGILCGLLGGLFFGLVNGYSRKRSNARILNVPLLGIRRSARNALGVGLTVGLAVGLTIWLIFWLLDALAVGRTDWSTDGLIFGLIFGAISGLGTGLWNGGMACIQHGLLRLLLSRANCLPLSFIPLLEDATERNLLRRIGGGGYRFYHKLLLNHLAASDTASISETVVQQD